MVTNCWLKLKGANLYRRACANPRAECQLSGTYLIWPLITSPIEGGWGQPYFAYQRRGGSGGGRGRWLITIRNLEIHNTIYLAVLIKKQNQFQFTQFNSRSTLSINIDSKKERNSNNNTICLFGTRCYSFTENHTIYVGWNSHICSLCRVDPESSEKLCPRLDWTRFPIPTVYGALHN